MIRIAQITDCHLQNDPRQDYRGLNVELHLQQVLDDLLENDLPDLILWTGDLVHHGGPEGYQRLSDKIQQLPVPGYWIPGNHDDVELMQLAGGSLNLRSIDCGHWQLILLDSTALPDGKGSGSLAQAELDFLRQQLQHHSDRHCLVVLHHNPVPVQSDWQDKIMLGNADSFWQIVSSFPRVKGVLCGHVHQDRDLLHKGIRVLMTPASSVQFKACQTRFTLESDPRLSGPAYRLLNLSSEGVITTSVKRLAANRS